MQDIIQNVHSKRFLLTYLAVVAFLLLFYMSQQETATSTSELSDLADGPYLLRSPQSLPNFLLRDVDQRLYTNAHLQGRWHFIYFFDGHCQPQCEAIWQVLSNLADRYAGQQLAFWVIDASNDQQLLHSPPTLPENVRIIYDPNAQRPLSLFFKESQGPAVLFRSLFLIDPKGQWQAGYRAPFTSEALQQFYLQLRQRYARMP